MIGVMNPSTVQAAAVDFRQSISQAYCNPLCLSEKRELGGIMKDEAYPNYWIENKRLDLYRINTVMLFL